MTKHEYGGIEVSGDKNAFGIGEQFTVNQQHNNDQLEALTKDLVNMLQHSDDIQGEKKVELKEIIEATESNLNSDEPNKTVIKSLLGSANVIMDSVTKSPALITAYDKWSSFISGLIG